MHALDGGGVGGPEDPQVGSASAEPVSLSSLRGDGDGSHLVVREGCSLTWW